jgi:hypothetical protein
MKRFTLLRNLRYEAFNASLPRFIALHHRFIAVNTVRIHAEIAVKLCSTFRHICKSKDNKVFGFVTEITEIYEFFLKLPMQIIAL